MRVDILMIGRISEKPYRQLIEQYLCRCRNRISVDIIRCRDLEEMRRKLSHDETIALDEQGIEMNSVEFSDWIRGRINCGCNRLTFCLGPAAGFDAQTLAKVSKKISLSRLTLNHQLALLVLCEQLYRSISIIFGEPYHKA